MVFGFLKTKLTKDDTPTSEGAPDGATLYRAFLGSLPNDPYRPYRKLPDTPEVVGILSADEPVQRDVLLLAIANYRQDRKKDRWTVRLDIQRLLITRLLQRKLPYTADDLDAVLQWSCVDYLSGGGNGGHAVSAIERYAQEHILPDKLRSALIKLRGIVKNYCSETQIDKLMGRIGTLLGEERQVQFVLDPHEPFGAAIIQYLHESLPNHRKNLKALLIYAQSADGGKPSTRWLNQARVLLESIEQPAFNSNLVQWFHAFDRPRSNAADAPNVSMWHVNDVHANLLKGLIWLSVHIADDELVRAIGKVSTSAQRKIPGVGPRCGKVTNAAVWALSQIDHPLAIGQLAVLRSRIKNKSVQKQLEKAMNATADRLGVEPNEVEEMAVPTYGITEVGKRVESLGEFTAKLIVTGTSSCEIGWLKADGTTQKSQPKSIKEKHADELKELKTAAKDIATLLPSQRDRIDKLFLEQKSWPYETWSERYINHPLVGTLARRLIWNINQTAVFWLDNQLMDVSGKPIHATPSDTVTLWHPIKQSIESIQQWRDFLADHKIIQPFKQAHREVYLLTDAERTTQVYSNRFAAHVLKQHQFNALCGARGWSNKLRLMVDDQYPPASRELPQWNLRAEFWIEGIGDEYGVDSNETGTYLRLSTDQVRFYPVDSAQLYAHAGGGGYEWSRYRGEDAPEPVPLEQIPPLVFSEIMRDVDLFVGVASVGNDPTWSDGGPQARHRDYWNSYSFGELSATANTRREILQRLIPRLKIAAQCSFSDKFLIVRGSLRTYKIHLGSGNILMEPNDQYLCIVSRQNMTTNTKVMLPFEGDSVLSIILSKAFMLADDKKITDQTITSQIKQ